MNKLLKSMSFVDGDPDIIPYSIIQNQVYGRPNYACGQIKLNSEIGAKIFELSQDNNYKTYLEIGTWCGLGTTKCLLDGIILRKDDSKLISVESNSYFYAITKKYWKRFFSVHNLNEEKFKLLYGSLVKYEDLDDNYITDSGHDKATYDYNQDILIAPTVSIDENIDVLCLDGGHFSSMLEWNMFKHQAKIVILDDIKTSKIKSFIHEILDEPAWEILYQSNERNGGLIAKKKSA
jgi:hypothetical protein